MSHGVGQLQRGPLRPAGRHLASRASCRRPPCSTARRCADGRANLPCRVGAGTLRRGPALRQRHGERTRLGAVQAAGAATEPPPPGASVFDYDRGRALDVRELGISRRDGVAIHDVTFASLSGGRTAAYLVAPDGAGGRGRRVLFVHWYAPREKDSNRTQFLEQASELARRGVVSLLVETMWSDPAWFRARDYARDYDHSVDQVRALRRALDVLLARPDVDPTRVAYVGHDFGAMYGAVLAGVDARVNAGLALQAGTTSFADWFLLSANLQARREAAVHRAAAVRSTRFTTSARPGRRSSSSSRTKTSTCRRPMRRRSSRRRRSRRRSAGTTPGTASPSRPFAIGRTGWPSGWAWHDRRRADEPSSRATAFCVDGKGPTPARRDSGAGRDRRGGAPDRSP